jgi:uncharacterized metal-binding protein YceD (DUF177 family)
MIKIEITGMKDGKYDLLIEAPVEKMNCIFEEFFGDVKLTGTIKKISNRFTLSAKAEVKAKMICDRSLKEFVENIESEVKLSFIADTKAYLENKGKINEEIESDILIREDIKYINITSEVIELLALQIPMKRIAPEYRDKELDEIFPELSVETFRNEKEVIDDRWSKLKNLKIN